MALPGGRSRRRHAFTLGVLILLTTVVSTLAVFANPPADEWFYLQLRGFGWLSALDPFEVLRSVPVVGALALLGLVGLRCRALLAGTALSLAGSFGMAVVLNLVAGRGRPFDSSLTGGDSFPSPAFAVLAGLAILVPVGIRVAGPGRALSVVASVLLWAVIVVAGLQEVYAALRWPFDVVGGVLIGATAAVATLAAVSQPSRLHAHCADCPWQRGEAVTERPAVELGGRSHLLYRLALAWSLLVAVGFGILAFRAGIPRLPGSGVMGTGLEAALNIGLVVLIVVGVLVAGRWHLTGAVLIAVFAVLLGYFSSVHYAPWVAVLIATAGFVPALLLWLQWQRAAGVRAALTVATALSAGLGVTVYLATATYSTFWGPTHPISVTPAPETDVVDWMWSGAVTDTSVTVKARTEEDHDRVRLVVSTEADLRYPTYSEPVRSEAASTNVVSLTVDGLRPAEEYHYALEVDGQVETSRMGSFSTFPRGPSSFTFAVSSCSRTGSNGVVYDAIRGAEPLLYINDGDWFYGDVGVDDIELFRRQYEANLTSPSQAALYASTPFAYVWDDHDSAGNDADSTMASWPAAMKIYRDYVPHYELTGGPEAPIYQAFTVGDVRILMTDPRSARDQPAGTMLGEEQRRWLVDQLASASEYGLVVWVNGSPWVGAAESGSDTWAGFAEERRAISNVIAENGVDNLLMVSGDAHMLAYDDGTHTDYSDSGGAGFPLFQVAALDRNGSVKGGPYTGPVLPGGGHFGLVRVDDDGRTVRVTIEARDWQDEVLFTRTFETTRD
jgi:phosphodiesterase/alkaline phosphatase D-like protein